MSICLTLACRIRTSVSLSQSLPSRDGLGILSSFKKVIDHNHRYATINFGQAVHESHPHILKAGECAYTRTGACMLYTDAKIFK